MSTQVVVLIVYCLALLGLAAWSRKDTHSLTGYFLAGKKLPFWVVAFSANATGGSGWMLLGLTGMGYAVGARAYWIPVGQILGLTCSWLLISRRLKKLGDETDSITIPDVLAAKFDDRRHLIRATAVVIIVVMVTAYVTAQMVATGKAFSSFVGWDYRVGVVVGSVFIIAYTLVGGFKAVSYTDVVQGILMLLGLTVVPFVAIDTAGGWAEMTASLNAMDPAFLDLFAFTSGGVAEWIAVLSFIGIGLPYLGVPQMLIRFMSAKDDEQVRKARTTSVLVMIGYTVGAVTAGIAGRALIPGLEDQEDIFPLLANDLFPAVIAGMLLVVVLSAIMSTVDSLLLLSSSAVVRDTMQKIVGSQQSDAQLAVIGKLTTLAIGLVALALAVPEATFIFWFVLFAWSGLGAAFGPATLCLLHYRKVTRAGIVAGMLGGFLVSTLWVLLFKASYHGLYEAIPGFLAGLILAWGVSALTYEEANGTPDEHHA